MFARTLLVYCSYNFGICVTMTIILPWLVCIRFCSFFLSLISAVLCFYVVLFAAINYTDINNSPVNTHNLFTHSTNNSTTSDSFNNHHLYQQPGSSSSSSNGHSSSNTHCCGHHPVLVYDSELDLSPGIAGYRLTNPSIMAIAPIRASLDVSKQGLSWTNLIVILYYRKTKYSQSLWQIGRPDSKCILSTSLSRSVKLKSVTTFCPI